MRKDGTKRRPFLLYDGRNEALGQALRRYGIPVALPEYPALPEPVRAHPDLLFLQNGGVLYTFADYLADTPGLSAILRNAGVPVLGLDLPAGAYPDDVWFDHLLVRNVFFGRQDRMPVTLQAGQIYRPVRQGYARCAGLALPCGKLITADAGIARAAQEEGVQTLLIRQGGVLLSGYPYGFIGGACAVLGDEVLFFGSLSRHPQGEEISEFLLRNGYRAVELWQGPLVDCGSVVAV